MSDMVPVRRALLSVSDKTGLIDLGKALSAGGVELLSTGGTAEVLRGAGLEVRDVSDVTGFPEMMLHLIILDYTSMYILEPFYPC